MRKLENYTEKDSYIYVGGDKGKIAKAMSSITEGATAYRRMDFEDVGGTNIHGRPGLTHDDFDAWRPLESTGGITKSLILQSDRAYRKHGLIRNVIDIMGDFGSQGIRISHQNERQQAFYRAWWKRVCGEERSERFLNILYRLGNPIVLSQTAKLNKTKVEKFKSYASAEDIKFEFVKPKRNIIPIKYNFLNPVNVELVGGAVSNFSGKKKYQLKMNRFLSGRLKSNLESVPKEVRDSIISGKAIPLPEDRTFVYHYKKDDWQEWADPMISAILLDVSIYEALKLTDRAALDGAMSHIRIFKLGDPANDIFPTEDAARKLSQILQSHTKGGTLDLVWTSDISIEESKSDLHNYLGEEKYRPTLQSLYAGLGIPPTLTGTFSAGGTTNNFISVKTLVQRLQYGRDVLVQFWNDQIKQVQLAMGFRHPAKIEFKHMDLDDVRSVKALLLQMADRNLISDELLQEEFSHDPELERVRIKRENKRRETGKMPPKSGPYHDPQFKIALQKIALQQGIVTPSEIGLDLEERKEGEVPGNEIKNNITDKKNSGQPQQGRPVNSKDKTKRKEKEFKPKLKAMEIWADEAQSMIAEQLNPFILEKFGKKNMRSLTSEEFKMSENIKFGVLLSLEPFSEVSINKILEGLKTKVNGSANDKFNIISRATSKELSRKLTIDEERNIRSLIYTELKFLE